MTARAQFWDNLAERYAKQPLPNPEATRRKLAHCKEKLSPDHQLLDVGCGTGTILLDLAPHVAVAHGIDISPEMIRIAEEKRVAQGADNATFHALTLDDPLPFEDGQFDMVCAYNILHLVEDRQEALRRIYRLLKPGGVFASSTPCLGGTWKPYGLMIGVMRLFGKAPEIVKLFRPEECIQGIRDVGFADVVRLDVGAQASTTFVMGHKPA